MATDPICGMYVREGPEALKRLHHGRTYYFCSSACVASFEEPVLDRSRLVASTAFAWVVAALVLALMYLPAAPWEPVEGDRRMLARAGAMLVLATPVQFVAGLRFYRGLAHAVRARAANMDTLIALGTSAAYFTSLAVVLNGGAWGLDVYFDVSVLVIAFILLGRTIEIAMKSRATESVRRLLDLRPRTAWRLEGDRAQKVPIEAVRPGDRLRVRAGERVPVDGRILEGEADLDESTITGESMPVSKGPGRDVVGGTVNTNGVLVMEATRVGRDTIVAQIADLVEAAQTGRAPIQRLVDAVSARFVPAVVIVAVASFLGWWLVAGWSPGRALLPAVAVLIIACPCALGLATPAALLATVARGAEQGVLVKQTDQLEMLAKVDTVVFDKTGTLTNGRPAVTDLVATPGPSQDEVLRLAAAVEAGSIHPLATAIVADASAKALHPPNAENFAEHAGHGVAALVKGQQVTVGSARWMVRFGVDPEILRSDRARLEAEGKTVLHVARGTHLIGLVALRDEPKPGAAEAVRALHDRGVQVALISGDNERTVRAIADELAIRSFRSEVLPADKAAYIQDLRSAGHRVAMVGDGVNDAPALAAADVGIALGGGTDVAKEAGGLLLLKDDPRDVANAVHLARRGVRKIRQNLFLAFIYNVALVPVAAFGLLNPILAGAAMGLSSLTVVGNSLLLRVYRAPLEARSAHGVRGARGNVDPPSGPGPADDRQEFRDPVCGMTVTPATAAGSSVWEGRTTWFCSPGCKAAFEADPERYAGEGQPRRLVQLRKA